MYQAGRCKRGIYPDFRRLGKGTHVSFARSRTLRESRWHHEDLISESFLPSLPFRNGVAREVNAEGAGWDESPSFKILGPDRLVHEIVVTCGQKSTAPLRVDPRGSFFDSSTISSQCSMAAECSTSRNEP